MDFKISRAVNFASIKAARVFQLDKWKYKPTVIFTFLFYNANNFKQIG